MKILECTKARTVSFDDVARFKCDSVLDHSIHIYHRNIKIKGNKRIKDQQLYRVLAYKICGGSTPGDSILHGHDDGANDSVIIIMMEKFIKHKRYYLKKVYLEEVKNAG